MNKTKKIITLVYLLSGYVYTETIKTLFGETLFVEPEAVIQVEFPYNINEQYVKTTATNGATISSQNNLVLLSTATNFNSSAILESRARLQYQPGQGHVCVFSSIFDSGITNNRQYVGIGDDENGFFFGYNGANFGVLHRRDSNDSWTTQSSWNQDTVDGTGLSGIVLDPTKGNSFKIQYVADFGVVRFYLQNPNDGTFILVHTLHYGNSAVVTSLSNPHLPLRAIVENYGPAASGVDLKVVSMASLVEGKNSKGFKVRYCVDNQFGDEIDTSLRTVLTIRNNETFHGQQNTIVVYPDQLAIKFEGQESRCVLLLNPSVASQSFTSVDSDYSVASYDTSSATVNFSYNQLLANFFFEKTESVIFNLKELGIVLHPGDELVLAARVLVNGRNYSNAAISWTEGH